MDLQSFDSIGRKLETQGALAALDHLIESLKEQGNLHGVFEALTMRARHELGLPLLQMGPSDQLPEEVRTPYEEKVVAACRTVGELFLSAGDIPNASRYFNILGETDQLRKAIDEYQPNDEDDEETGAVIEIAISHGVHPHKGLSLVLERYGTCQSITSCEGLLAGGVRTQDHEKCIELLVRTIHEELIECLREEISSHDRSAPTPSNIPLLIKDRDWLFAEDNYHIDTSHLCAVIRMARQLPKCEVTYLAMHLCEYGSRLSEIYSHPDPAPFQKIYSDSMIYFETITGIEVDKGLEHFERKARKANPEESDTYPHEVYVNLLVMAGRENEAISYAARKLNRPGGQGISSPTVNELCQSTGRFEDMAKLARERNDLLSFTAGLVQHKTSG